MRMIKKSTFSPARPQRTFSPAVPPIAVQSKPGTRFVPSVGRSKRTPEKVHSYFGRAE